MKIDLDKLDLILARRQMSTAELRTGTSPQTLTRIRRGMEIKPKTAGIIAKTLGVDVAEIIERKKTNEFRDYQGSEVVAAHDAS